MSIYSNRIIKYGALEYNSILCPLVLNISGGCNNEHI